MNEGGCTSGLLAVIPGLYLVILGILKIASKDLGEGADNFLQKYSRSSLGGVPDLFTALKSQVANSAAASEFQGGMKFTARAGIRG